MNRGTDHRPGDDLRLRQLLACLFVLSFAAACSGRSGQNRAVTGGTAGSDVWAGGGEVGSGGLEVDSGEMGSGGALGQGGEIGNGGALAGDGGRGSGGADAAIVGAGGLDGGTTTANTGSTVTFYNGQARGAMTGKGWVALGPLETVSSPTCQGVPLSSSVPCSSYLWPNPTMLCTYGTIAPYYASESTRAWGLMVAVYATDPPGQGLGQSFQSITMGFRAVPNRGIQLHVHRKGDPPDVIYGSYIFGYGSTTYYGSVAFKDFSKDQDPLSPADVPNLDWIGIFVPPTPDREEATTLCLESIEFE